jgi:hypothetical protein
MLLERSDSLAVHEFGGLIPRDASVGGNFWKLHSWSSRFHSREHAIAELNVQAVSK